MDTKKGQLSEKSRPACFYCSLSYEDPVLFVISSRRPMPGKVQPPH